MGAETSPLGISPLLVLETVNFSTPHRRGEVYADESVSEHPQSQSQGQKQMGDPCGGCRSREEEIFWTHFQCIHFSQSLRGDFLQRLEIPEKFAKHMMKKLPETVTVKGPSGIEWDLGLTADDDTLFFDGGWKNFALDHSLEEKDLLIFKYNGLSQFDVLMFEGRSIPEKSTNNDINNMPSTQPINTTTTNKKARRAGSSVKSLHTRHLGGKELFSSDGEVKLETGFDGARVDEDEFSPHPSCFNPPLTQFEKANVLLKAQEALTNDGFMVVMKPTHVWKRFYMAIPIVWTAKHLLKENMDVILRINEHIWRTRFNYHKARGCGGLSAGWKSFATDNSLIEHDVCVFEPSDMGIKPVVLDVCIFRVLGAIVEAPLPLTAHPASEPEAPVEEYI
ncbi:hypothetical protein V6N13_139000 [Hibiscus sabdariffa]